MANLVLNIAKGRVAEFYNRVQANDPGTAVLTIVALVVTGDQDAAILDVDTLAALLALGNVAEATNTGYARVDLADGVLSAIAPDDTNNRMDIDIPDPVFSSVSAGDNWTDLVVCYNPTGGADSTIIPLTLHDFVVTPDGSDITANVAATGFYRAA
jgi:hypothetical protein